ncbi:inc metabolism membrane protein [Malassezia nana]|uniref:Inc metabolism membrane protein n=1 Tax=Malassezia nana TaxID=180528 RepID=A0AAF0J1C0_9BASI|nr:inc metabolism membrane protein [Malassezia nana]
MSDESSDASSDVALSSAVEVHAIEEQHLHRRRHAPRRKSTAGPASLEESDGGAWSDTGSFHSVVDSLDLAPSLPYWFAYVRARMGEYVEDMDRLLHANHTQGALGHMETRLGAAYDRLARIVRESPRVHGVEWLDKIPSRQDLLSRFHALMADWERRASTFHPTLFAKDPPTMHETYAEWAARVPATAVYLTEEVQKTVATLRSHMPHVAMPSRPTLNLPDHILPPDLLERFERKLEMIGQQGRAASAQLAHAMHDVEDALYHTALQLAQGGRALITYHSLPELWRNNDFIITGYRFIPAKSWRQLLLSIFQLHNETGNIHTHMGGLILVAALFWFTGMVDHQTTAIDRSIQTLYLLAAAKCLICSVSWHVMAGCADLQWFLCFACIDYTGISWLVAASLETLVYNGFYCQPEIIAAYTVGVVALGLCMAVLPWAPWFNDIKYRTLRILLFVFMALMGVVPFAHGAYLHGVGPMSKFFRPIVPSIVSYIIGVVLYGFRFPERLAPGRFDLIGHSHQLWHVAIVLAIFFHYRAILLFHESRFEYSCTIDHVPAPWLQYLYQAPGAIWLRACQVLYAITHR